MKNKLLGKTLRVLEMIASSPEPLPLKTVASELKMTPGTLSRITSDLCEYGLIEKIGYHRVRPSLGLIRLGQDAMKNLSLQRVVPPLIRARAEEQDANGVFVGLHQLNLVYLYSTASTGEPGKHGLSYWEPLLRPRLAAVILGATCGDAELDANIRGELERRYSKLEIESFAKHCRVVKENGYIAHREQGRGWVVGLPVFCNGRCYAVALFGP